jgi:dTDP-4-dehydrorhamnose 3,5-epimerase
MSMRALGIAGAWVFDPVIHADERGSFRECFRGQDFAAELGYEFDLQQANCSVSRGGVIRGIHFTDVPPGQAKYVMCVSGSVLDVIVDLRVGSPTFGRWEGVPIDAQTGRAVFLSEGLGHAFMAVSPQATVVYMCSTSYAPGIEHGVNPLDPAIGITWPAQPEVILSAKDAAAPMLADAERAGLLPTYAASVKHAAWLRGA